MKNLGRMTGRIRKTVQDNLGLGRWTYTKYFGKEGRTLTVVTVYIVAQAKITPGDNITYNQQYISLRRQGIDNPKPKKYFLNIFYR